MRSRRLSRPKPIEPETTSSNVTGRVRLDPGSTLLPYIDGLVERRGADIHAS